LIAWLAASYGASTLAGQFLPTPDTGARFGHLAGNVSGTLWWIAVGFSIGGFAEEMIFRGFIINRLRTLLPPGGWGNAMAVLLQAILFGAAHAYNRGLYGFIVLGTVGVVLGTCYIMFGRNLWPVILAHGLGNALGFLLRYFDLK
jgi:membrane protease YdiL (CAAX protease family)